MENKINVSDMCKSLKDVLWPTFYCDNEVYTIKPVQYSSKLWFDKTSCESLVNHVHLDDYFCCDSDEGYKEFAFKIVDMWITKLKITFPEKHFTVFLTLEHPGWTEESNCIIRFCLKRKDEPSWTSKVPDGKTLFAWET